MCKVNEVTLAQYIARRTFVYGPLAASLGRMSYVDQVQVVKSIAVDVETVVEIIVGSRPGVYEWCIRHREVAIAHSDEGYFAIAPALRDGLMVLEFDDQVNKIIRETEGGR